MEMQQVRYFLALSQRLNFTRAAEDCHVTQPALTRAIQALEAELGGALIRRERQQSHLTPLGRRMLPLLRQCYEIAQSARALARAVGSSEVAPLSLGMARGISGDILQRPLAAMFRAFPGAELKIRRGTETEILGLLRQGEVDLAIAGPLGRGWDRLDHWPLLEDCIDVVVCEGHHLASRTEIGLEELAGERVFAVSGCDMAGAVLHRLRALGIAAGSTHDVESDQDLVALLRADAGVGLLRASTAITAPIRHVRLAGAPLHRTISVYVVAGRRRSQVAAALLSLLRAAGSPGAAGGEP